MFESKDLIRCHMKQIWLSVLLTVLLSLLLPGSARAQPAPYWNRSVEAISVLPDADSAGQFVIRGYVAVDANDLTATEDLSTIVEFRLNGIVFDQQVLRLSVEPASGSPCGSCGFFEICSCGTNPSTGVFSCECGSLLSWVPTSASLQPSDEIMVILYPAPGAQPEQSGQTSDDQLIITYQDRPVFWERRILNVDIQPVPVAASPAADSFFDVFVDVGLYANYDGQLNLETDIVVLVSGVEYTSAPVSVPDEITWGSCVGTCTDQDCAFLLGGTPTGTCNNALVPWNDCECSLASIPQVVIPAVPAPSPDELTVFLKPAPGALPELPGCLHTIPGDLDGDCDEDLNDLSLFAQRWLDCDNFNPDKCFQ